MNTAYAGSEIEFLIRELKATYPVSGNDHNSNSYDELIDISAEGAINISAF